VAGVSRRSSTRRDRVVSVAHLSRRFATSLSPRPPSADDETWARGWLTDEEILLWVAMPAADRRHAIEVARRFRDLRPDATRPQTAGALLHDVGKVQSGLGTLGRVAATVVGPRTRRFRQYHDHEEIGAAMAADAGSDPVTVATIRGRGPAAADLRAADDSI
jgi:HD domain